MKLRLLPLIGALIFGCTNTMHRWYNEVSIYKEEDATSLYHDASEVVIKKIQEKPNAIILLPTGSTPIKLYKNLIKRFEEDSSIDFSNATFFNLDEYVGLEPEHPLSYRFYMDSYFYKPLNTIDQRRAPKKYYLPSPAKNETPEMAANRYAKMLETQEIDLAILGVGGAYPEEGKLKGGHLAFNEPGTKVTDGTRVVELTEKTRLDTAFRFSSLKSLINTNVIEGNFSTDVPNRAISAGLKEILNAKKIIVLATGEDKAPVVEHAILNDIDPDFPVSYLKNHKNVKWYIDEAAAFLLNKDKANPPANVCMQNALPQNKSIMIISPHPDDDVISMGATLKELVALKNKIHIVYAVTGSNAVRKTDVTFLKLYPEIKEQNPELLAAELEQKVKEKAREIEATNAVAVLGIKPEQLTFFRADYYKRRGIPNLEPITETDIKNMVKLLEKHNPEVLFFAGENDPHGAHGLSTQLVAKAVKNTKMIFYGYRGAYAEWPLSLNEQLMIYRFDQTLMDQKIKAIKEHVSQLDPLFPSFDPRPFWQRAYDRNKESGLLLQKLCGNENYIYAEVFKRFSYEDFIKRYA